MGFSSRNKSGKSDHSTHTQSISTRTNSYVPPTTKKAPDPPSLPSKSKKSQKSDC